MTREEEAAAWLEGLKATGQIVDYVIVGRSEETGDPIYTIKEHPVLDRLVLTDKDRAMIEKYIEAWPAAEEKA